MLRSILRVCVTREFTIPADRTNPVGLTVDLVDDPGHPTRAAVDRVLERLHP